MKEPVITTKIVTALNGVVGCRAKKRHSGRFSSGDPDISGCFRGYSFFVEMKMLRGELSDLQANQLEKWKDSGAATFVGIYHPEDKLIAFTSIRSDRMWKEFSGKHGVMDLWSSDSISPRLRIRDFNFKAWLENEVWRGQ